MSLVTESRDETECRRLIVGWWKPSCLRAERRMSYSVDLLAIRSSHLGPILTRTRERRHGGDVASTVENAYNTQSNCFGLYHYHIHNIKSYHQIFAFLTIISSIYANDFSNRYLNLVTILDFLERCIYSHTLTLPEKIITKVLQHAC